MANTSPVNGTTTSATSTAPIAPPTEPEFKPVAGPAPSEEKVIVLDINKDILYVPAWNCRKSLEHNATPDSEEQKEGGVSWEDFKRSIYMGQDTPVIVRPSTKGNKPYELVSGFRRVRAILENAEENKKAPLVKAVVRKLTDAEARKLNLRENTARNSLSGPDLVFGVKDLMSRDPELTSVALAADLGKNQSYINSMMRIAKGLDEKVLNRWRDLDSSRISYKEILDIAQKKKSEQEAAFNELTAAESEEEDGKKNKHAWVKGACEKLAAVGNVLGRAAQEGYIVIENEDEFFMTYAGIFTKVKKTMTDAQRAKIVAAFKSGVAAGADAKAAEDAAEDDEASAEETVAKHAAGKKKKAAKK